MDTAAAPKRKRRSYTQAWRQSIVELALAPGASVARIAREHDLNANQVFKWIRQNQQGSLAGSKSALVPVRIDDSESAAPAEEAASAGEGHIELRGGQVHIAGPADPTTLRVVLEMLR
jgi:transposase